MLHPLMDTFDIWIGGGARPVLVDPGHFHYRTAVERARMYSARSPRTIVYMYYGGCHVKGRPLARPLAVFLDGDQLACPIHLTSYEPDIYWIYRRPLRAQVGGIRQGNLPCSR